MSGALKLGSSNQNSPTNQVGIVGAYEGVRGKRRAVEAIVNSG